MPSDLLPSTPTDAPGPSWALPARRNPLDDLPPVPSKLNSSPSNEAMVTHYLNEFSTVEEFPRGGIFLVELGG